MYVCTQIIDDEIMSSFAVDGTPGQSENAKDVGILIACAYFHFNMSCTILWVHVCLRQSMLSKFVHVL
jgi:hypothetical protein